MKLMTMSDEAVETIREMWLLSEAVDEAYGTSGYDAALIALALVAREFLRRVPEASSDETTGPR